MKKILNISLLLVTLVSFTGCLFEEETLFDESAAIRSNNAVSDVENKLTNAENGWLLEYYPDTASYGGFQLLVSFSEDGTTAFSADARLRVNPSDKKESMYEVIAVQGPVITFNTSNGILHRFSNPENDNGTGLNGDYEFIVMDSSDDRMELKGKKHGMKLTMKKMPSNIAWEAYLENLNKVVNAIDYPYMTLQMGGETLDLYTGSIGRFLDFFHTDASGDSRHYTGPFIVTPQGIDFYKPFELNGVSVSSLTYDEAVGALKGIDSNGGAVILTPKKLDPNALFKESRNAWVMDKEFMSANLKGYYEQIEENAPKVVLKDEGEYLKFWGAYYQHYVDNTKDEYRFVFNLNAYRGLQPLAVNLTSTNRLSFREWGEAINMSFFAEEIPGFSNFVNTLMKKGVTKYDIKLNDLIWPDEASFTSTDGKNTFTLFNEGQIKNLITDPDKLEWK